VLADALLESLARRIGKPIQPLDAEVVAVLRAHDWPGNVRELRNTLERAIILAREGRIGPDLLGLSARVPAAGAGAPGVDPHDLSVKRGMRQLEEQLIRRALEQTGGNRTRAAELLELSPRALQYKIKEYGLAALNPADQRADTARTDPRPGHRR